MTAVAVLAVAAVAEAAVLAAVAEAAVLAAAAVEAAVPEAAAAAPGAVDTSDGVSGGPAPRWNANSKARHRARGIGSRALVSRPRSLPERLQNTVISPLGSVAVWV